MFTNYAHLGIPGDIVRKILIFAVLILCGAAVSIAQGPKAKTSSDKWEIFGGYSFTRAYGDFNEVDGNNTDSDNYFQAYNINGGQAAVSYFPAKHFGLTYSMTFTGTGDRKNSSEDFSQNVKTQEYVIGPTFRYSLNKWKGTSLFAHQLFGATHASYNFSFVDCSETGICGVNGFTAVSGGGLDVKLRSHLSIRPVEVEYSARELPLDNIMSSAFSSAKLNIHNLRYSAGAVINF
jgi:hypothetical protein